MHRVVRLLAPIVVSLVGCGERRAREPEPVRIVDFTAVATAPDETPAAAPGEVREPPELEPLASVCPHLLIPKEAGAGRESACRKYTHYEGESYFECVVRSIGNGVAVQISIVTGVGDFVSGRTWVCSRATADKLVALDDAAGLEASPDGSFVVTDGLKRRDLVTQKVTPLTSTPCFTPQLSPGGKWFVCSNPHHDVMRVPVGGGKLSLVARSTPPARSSTNEDNGYPPVTFVSPTEIEVLVPGEAQRRRAPWHE